MFYLLSSLFSLYFPLGLFLSSSSFFPLHPLARCTCSVSCSCNPKNFISFFYCCRFIFPSTQVMIYKERNRFRFRNFKPPHKIWEPIVLITITSFYWSQVFFVNTTMNFVLVFWRVGWVGGLCLRRRGLHRWLCWGNLKERNQLQDLDVDGRIILKCILNKQAGMVWTGFVFSDGRVKWQTVVITAMNIRVP